MIEWYERVARMRRMTVLFEDEALYRAVKVEAARRNRHLKDLVPEALRDWLESQEDAELLPAIEEARAEWHEMGGIEASKFFRALNERDSQESRGLQS